MVEVIGRKPRTGWRAGTFRKAPGREMTLKGGGGRGVQPTKGEHERAKGLLHLQRREIRNPSKTSLGTRQRTVDTLEENPREGADLKPVEN